jgi:hypothetical protein
MDAIVSVTQTTTSILMQGTQINNSQIKNGRTCRKDRPKHRRLKYLTAERILAIPMSSPVAPGQIISAADTWRLIDEMLATGVTKAAIARALGNKGPGLQVRRDRVLKRTADRIAKFHHEIFERRSEAA